MSILCWIIGHNWGPRWKTIQIITTFCLEGDPQHRFVVQEEICSRCGKIRKARNPEDS